MRNAMFILVGVCLLCGSAGTQTPITPQQAARAGYRTIAPEKAVEAVRSFIGDTQAKYVVSHLYAPAIMRYDGPYYEVQLQPNKEWYRVRSTDGSVIEMFRPESRIHQPNTQLTLTQQQAQTIAVEFARRHYPAFSRGPWQLAPERYRRRDDDYVFFWFPILSRSGALGNWELEVGVDGITGRVVSYRVPPNRPVLAPTVPSIPLAQAMRIAAMYAPFDTNIVPFKEVWLQVTEDKVGVQRLEWQLIAVATPTNHLPNDFSIHIDAITGRVIAIPVPLGSEAKPVREPLPPPHPPIFLQTEEHRPVSSQVEPTIEGCTTWIRVELLRGFGARVQADTHGVGISSNGQTLNTASLGAKWQDYGWWVPLRQTAEALGWRVEWLPASRVAIVHSTDTQLFRSGQGRIQ